MTALRNRSRRSPNRGGPITTKYKGGPPLIASAADMKAQLAEIRAESALLTDTAVKREDCKAVLLLALTERDLANLRTLADRSAKVRNYGVLVRRLIAREAK